MSDPFLTRYRKSPPRDYSETLYKRINVPMNTKRSLSLRRLTFAALCLALAAALAVPVISTWCPTCGCSFEVSPESCHVLLL